MDVPTAIGLGMMYSIWMLAFLFVWIRGLK